LSTSKLHFLIVAVVLAHAAGSPTFAAGHESVRVLLAAQTVGQTDKTKAANDRQEVEGLLLRARQAMKDGDLETADTLVSRAEKMKVEFRVFHFGDTPKKARADLNAARKSGRKGAAQRPSQKATPEMPKEKTDEGAEPAGAAPDRLPAAEKPTTPHVHDPTDEAPLALPQSEGRLKQSPISQRAVAPPDDEIEKLSHTPAPKPEHPATPGGNSKSRSQSDAYLLAARRALAVGDVRRANEAIDAARKMNVAYGYHEDTPDKIDAAIRNYRQVTETMAGRQDEVARHQLADLLMEQAQQLMRWREFDEAERLVQTVKGLRINYGPFEAKPETLLDKIAAARRQAVAQAGPEQQTPPGAAPARLPLGAVAGGPAAKPLPKPLAYPATRAVYESQNDSTLTVKASAQEAQPANEDGDTPQPVESLPLPIPQVQGTPDETSSAKDLFQQGQQALKDGDSKKALELFRQAHATRSQLDSTTSQRLQDYLQMLSTPPANGRGAKAESLLDTAAPKQQVLIKQVLSDLAQKEIAAGKARAKDPKRATEILKEARAAVEAAGLEAQERGQLLRRVDRRIADLDKYLAENRAEIELNEANKEVLKEVDRRQETKIEIDDQLAKFVDEFNKLMDEERWAEAEVVAKRARELDPDNALVKQLIWQQKLVTRTQRNQKTIDDKEKAVWETLDSVEQAAIPTDDREPYQMPDIKKWQDLTDKRKKQLADRRSRRSERELEIERKLKTPISLKFRNRPLSEVIEQLGKLTAINLHLDQKGLDEEGVSADTLVTIDLTHDISLKSALNLILEQLHLSYVIKNEVLLITSEQLRDGETYIHTYDVADLVIPIPNFVPNGRSGLAGAISDGYNISSGAGMGGGPGAAYMAGNDGISPSGNVNPQVLAQMSQLMPGGMGSRAASGSSQSPLFGPGGMGHGVLPDFDPLIELITTTVKPQTWDEVGGPGSISPVTNNLSLVISQTEEVHQAIADLLEQLRRNQDLQVTIEVRFITLNDNFFERIGVDFQFNIVNSATGNPNGAGNLREVVGLETQAGNAPSGNAPNFAPNLELPFRQNSFNLATPQFGQPVDVASFGFAILSDMEAYLLVNAAQGDRRSNVLQAPKVTLFNGQTATVTDSTQTPFVISVIPVVGDFAAAYQPVIAVLSEGTMLTVQATISHDRRFVRLTVLPYFSTIGNVQEFTFSGSSTTNAATASNNSTNGAGGDSTASAGNSTVSSNGITIQLPSLAIVSVLTTVSVPDGGTVLLGGIKRLSEGRNEFGVPILSKLPYINRLFKNVGIGRETQSLMMMVTPRIIIQEEEEERLGIQLPP
jgi:general secretion pathway protein D